MFLRYPRCIIMMYDEIVAEVINSVTSVEKAISAASSEGVLTASNLHTKEAAINISELRM